MKTYAWGYQIFKNIAIPNYENMSVLYNRPNRCTYIHVEENYFCKHLALGQWVEQSFPIYDASSLLFLKVLKIYRLGTYYSWHLLELYKEKQVFKIIAKLSLNVRL